MTAADPQASQKNNEVAQILAQSRSRGLRRWVLRALLAVAVLGGGWGLYSWRSGAAAATRVVYRTEPLARGDLAVKVTATGTLEALNSVDVGAEITGRTSKIATASMMIVPTFMNVDK